MRLTLPHLLLRSASLIVALGVLPTTSQAQFGGPAWRPRPWQAMPAAQFTMGRVGEEVPSHRHQMLLLAGGLAGYAAMRSLLAVTVHLAEGERNCRPGLCLSTITVVAAALAAPTLVPLGVHLANGSQGDLGGVLLVGARSGVSAEGLLVAVPVGQILAAVAAEIIVSRRSRALPEP